MGVSGELQARVIISPGHNPTCPYYKLLGAHEPVRTWRQK